MENIENRAKSVLKDYVRATKEAEKAAVEGQKMFKRLVSRGNAAAKKLDTTLRDTPGTIYELTDSEIDRIKNDAANLMKFIGELEEATAGFKRIRIG